METRPSPGAGVWNQSLLVSWIPSQVQDQEGGRSDGGWGVFACGISLMCPRTPVPIYVGVCAGVNGVFGWRGVSLFCPVSLPEHRNSTGRRTFLPLQVSLELAFGQSCVAGKVNPGKPASTAALSIGLLKVFLHRGCYAFSLFFPLTNLLEGEALIGLHF